MSIRTGVRIIHAVEFGEEQSQGVRVLGTRLGVLLWRSLLLCSRRQEGCMSRRGQDAMGTPACRFPRWWKSFRGVRIW